MSKAELSKFLVLVVIRCLTSLLDLAAIAAVGYVATSVAMFISDGSDPHRRISLGQFYIPAANIHTLPSVVILVLSLFILKALTSLRLTRALAFVIAKVEARSARTIAEGILNSSWDNYKSFSREEIMYIVQNGSPNAFNGVLNAFGTLVSEGFLFVLLVCSFSIVNVSLTISMLLYFLTVGFLIQFLVGRKMQQAGDLITQESMAANLAISDLVSANRELRLAGKRELFIAKIYDARLKAANGLARQTYLASSPRHIIETALILGIAAFGVVEGLSGNLVKSATIFGIFLTGGFRLMASMLPLQTAMINLKGSMPGAKLALDRLAKIRNNSTAAIAGDVSPDLSGRIHLSQVGFTYPNSAKPALFGVDITINKGEFVALIGDSGSGKSTIANLLSGLTDPTDGLATYSGVQLSTYVQAYPGKIAYVAQQPGRLTGTLAYNIALGGAVDPSRLSECVRLSNLDEVVASLPDGLDTDLGKHADGLSGGQMQRLGIARALYTNPDVIVLDEATSGLDSLSEQKISQTIESLRGTKTLVVIAHRLNTVKSADRVYLVEAGSIKASGTFDGLRESNPKLEEAIQLSNIE